MGDVGECGEKLCWLMYTVKRAGRCCVLPTDEARNNVSFMSEGVSTLAAKPSQAKFLETP